MKILVFVPNSELKDALPVIKKVLAGGRPSIRNPRYFRPQGAEAADKVLVWQKQQAVEQHYKSKCVPVEHLVWNGQRVPAFEGDKTPSESWTKKELLTVAKANGLDIDGRNSKQTILEALNEAGIG